MSVYFTSDLHMSHETVAKMRGFDNLEEYDSHILDVMYDQTQKGDQIWVLGDLTMGGATKEDVALRRLKILADNGRTLHFIPGNHDSCHPMANKNSHNRVKKFYETFESVQLFARRKIAGQYVFLSHFPPYGDHKDVDRGVEYRLRDEGQYFMHGHTHSSLFTQDDNHRYMHIGWDVAQTMIPIETIQEWIEDNER